MDDPSSCINYELLQFWTQEWLPFLLHRTLEDEPTSSCKQAEPCNEDSGESIILPLDNDKPKPWLYESSDGKEMVKASLIPIHVRIIGPNTPGPTDPCPTCMYITIDKDRTITNVEF
ncbi:hypothetical protein IWW56_001288 [Coemansia sp. RSA 2131]|nr:hypothetical protein IWW56_001288 [Coemansia sp. RSA 2131]